MMRNILIIGAILFAGVLFGQTKKNVSKTWENRDSEIAQKVFSKYQEKENKKFEAEKADLIKFQRKLKIEIINEGETEKLNQIFWLKVVKVNDGKFEQIIKTDSTKTEIKRNYDKSIWRDEAGGILFERYNPMKISQEYVSAKNNKGINETDIENKEIYETTNPVYSFSLRIYTHRKDFNAMAKTNFSKIINVYSEDKLIKTYTFTFDDLKKLEGIQILDFKLDDLKK